MNSRKRFPFSALSALAFSLSLLACAPVPPVWLDAGSRDAGPADQGPPSDLAAADPGCLLGKLDLAYPSCEVTCLPAHQLWPVCLDDGSSVYHADALLLTTGRLAAPACGASVAWTPTLVAPIALPLPRLSDCSHSNRLYLPAPGHGVYSPAR